MLAIRFQRVGRSGHAEFRIIVQEAHRTPSSGRIVAQIGHYNPHTKVTKLDKEKAQFYIGNGAQPSTRVALLMKSEGVTLPSWVKIDSSKARSVKNTDKLRKHQPAQEEPIVEEAPAVVAEESEPVAESTEA
jgi:small subunit ribosomal protein S16